MSPRRTATAPKRPRTTTVTDEPPRPHTLREMLEDLGPQLLEVCSAPAGLDVVVGRPVVHDPHDASGVQDGDVVLAVGVAGTGREAAGVVEDAAASGAAAVVLKLDGSASPAVLEASVRTGIALLGAPTAVEWGQLYTMLRAAAAAPPSDGAASGVPMGDLFALANAVAAMVGGAVTIEDPRSRLLAYSSGEHTIDEPRREVILGRGVPEHWLRRLRDAGVFRRLWSSDEVVRYEDPGLQPRIAVAVRAGGEILGSIWVAEGDEPLGAEAEAALREAARIAALHLIRHRTTEDLERRRRGDLLLGLLEGRTPVRPTAAALGLDPDEHATVVAFEGGDTDGTGRLERAADLVALYCESFRRTAALVTVGRTIYVLLPGAAEPAAARLRTLASDVVDRTAATIGTELRAGIGSTVGSLDLVARSRREADQVVRVLVDGPPSRRVASIADVRSAAILLTLRDLADENPSLRLGSLQDLVGHDAEKGTAYVPTLRAYLDAFGDVPAAARALNVHPNTFRYRLRRVIQLAKLRLDDPDERLVVELQLRFLSG